MHCGVCGTRLYEQTDNYGSFPVSADFKGWDDRTVREDRCVKDTCRDCSKTLTGVITEAANKIVAANLGRVEALRIEVADARARQAQFEKDKADFESEWHARSRSRIHAKGP